MFTVDNLFLKALLKLNSTELKDGITTALEHKMEERMII
jgi:hypothetical protein